MVSLLKRIYRGNVIWSNPFRLGEIRNKIDESPMKNYSCLVNRKSENLELMLISNSTPSLYPVPDAVPSLYLTPSDYR